MTHAHAHTHTHTHTHNTPNRCLGTHTTHTQVNIIRDYLEDIAEDPPRIFWPKEIWGQYTDDVHAFRRPEQRERAVQCLNAMVSDALKHIPDCLAYMAMLRDPTVFQFCAVPQVMAVATLAKLYNNPDVFTGVVKISKGLACQLMLDCGSQASLLRQFGRFMSHLLAAAERVEPEGPIVARLRDLLECNAALQSDERQRGATPGASQRARATTSAIQVQSSKGADDAGQAQPRTGDPNGTATHPQT